MRCLDFVPISLKLSRYRQLMISREYLETCLERFNMGLQLIKDRLTLLTLGRFGAPERILTDRGTAFHNELVSELIHMCRAEHELTIAYSKEENAIVERANQEVIRHLRALLFDKRAYKSGPLRSYL